jgi:hypothetical protein
MTEHRFEPRPFGARPRMPLGHVARLGGVEPEAEAEADRAVVGEHSRDERLVAALQPHRVNVDES